MRTVSLSTGATCDVVPLTRRQIKALGHLGVSSRGFFPEADQFVEAYDGILATQLTEDFLADLPEPDVRELFYGIVAETWGSEKEEKNLNGSGPTDQTPSA